MALKILTRRALFAATGAILALGTLAAQSAAQTPPGVLIVGQIAEPKATLAFTGRRVIESTIREKLPEDFQTSEYYLDHGMLDMVVHRHDLRERLATVIGYLTASRQAA